MHYEIDLINAVLDSQDWGKVLELNLQNLFEAHPDIWAYVADYASKYSQLPSKKLVKDNFSEFEFLNTSETPLEYYVDEARNHSLTQNVRNNLHKAIEILKNAGPMATMNFLSSSSNKLMKDAGTLKDTNLSLDYEDRVKNFKLRSESDTSILGIPSGIRPIDEIYGGWQPGDLAIIMGWTGTKKTWLAILFAINAWKAGYRPLIISLEMNKYQMGYRIDTILNGGEHFTNDELTNAKNLTPEEYMKWAEDTFEGKPPFYLVTAEGLESATQNTVQAKIEQYNPDLVILDYHGLFEDADGSGTETNKVMNLSKAFKRLAIKYNVAIIDLAAVTPKDGGKDVGSGPPELHEIAWSKQLAFDADLVLAIHSVPHSNISQIVSRKVRRCSEFGFYLEWDVNSGVWAEKYEVDNGNEF
jgi:replicative DNA helicase